MANDFIIDMETLGKSDNAVILSIGVLKCPEEPLYSITELAKNGMHIKLNRKQQLAVGRIVEKDTIEWWEKQGEAAKEVLSSLSLVDIVPAFYQIKSFCYENGFNKNSSHIWSRGLIDQRWWQSFVKSCQKYDPNISDFLDFWLWLDIRTLLTMLTGDGNGAISNDDPRFIKHNALSDCIMDFLRIQEAMKGND